MNLNYSITLKEAIATTLAEASGVAYGAGHDMDESIGLAAIELAEFSWLGRNGEFYEFLQKQNPDQKTFGFIGMNPVGQAIAKQVRLGFGMDILYHHWQSVPAVEDGLDARCLSADDLLLDADLICVVLPLQSELLGLITRNYLAPNSRQSICIGWRRSPVVERAAIHMGRFYADSIQLEALADIAGTSKFSLVREFSATLGITPHRFQLLLRVVHARSLLQHGVEIGEIAYRLGFADQSHFGRCFRSIAGMAPGQYQKAVLRNPCVGGRESGGEKVTMRKEGGDSPGQTTGTHIDGQCNSDVGRVKPNN